MRLLPVAALIASLVLPASGSAAPPVPTRVSVHQQDAAHVGLVVGLAFEGSALTAGLIYAIRGRDFGVPVVAGLVDGLLTAPTVMAFEGTLRDGTVEGFYRGAGVGLLQKGLQALAMGTLLPLGMLNGDQQCTNPSFGCSLEFGALIVVPLMVAELAVGGTLTTIGAIFLGEGPPSSVASIPRFRVLPTFSAGPGGASLGLVAAF